MEPDRTSGSNVLLGALVAGGAVFFAGPLVLLSGKLSSEDGAADGLAQLFNEGGWPALAMPVLALAAAGFQALLVGLTRRAPLMGLLAPVGPAAPLLLGAFGFYNGMQGSMRAVAHVAPADKETIMFAATSEAAACLLIAACFAGALWAGLGVGLWLASSGQRDPHGAWPLKISAVAAGGLGVWAIVDAQRLGYLREAFKLAAHVAPADRVTLLAIDIPKLARAEQLAPVAAALGLLALAAMIALGFARGGQRARVAGALAAVAVFFGLAVRMVEVRTLTRLDQFLAGAMVVPPEDEDGNPLPMPEREEAPPPAPAPIEFAGAPFLEWGDDLGVDAEGPRYGWSVDSLAKATGKARERCESAEPRDGECPLLFIRVFRGAKTAAVLEVLRDASDLGVAGARLIGRSPVDPKLELPRSVQVLRTAFQNDVACDVLFHREASASARLTENGVELDGKLLPFASWSPGDAAGGPYAALRVPRQLDPELLLRGVTTLRHAGYGAVLVLED